MFLNWKIKRKRDLKMSEENIPGPGPDEKEKIIPDVNFTALEGVEIVKEIDISLPPEKFKEVIDEANTILGIKDIVDKTEEIIKKNPFENLMEKLKKVLDFNKDDKIDFQDLKEFLKLFAGVLIVVYFVIFTLERDEILAMWISGIWDFGFLYTNIVFVGISAIGAFFFNMFKKRWIETDSLMISYKVQSEDAHKIIAEINFEHDLEIEKLNHKHALELMSKEIEIKTKEELARIEIFKVDILDEIKKLLPGPKVS